MNVEQELLELFMGFVFFAAAFFALVVGTLIYVYAKTIRNVRTCNEACGRYMDSTCLYLDQPVALGDLCRYKFRRPRR